MTQKELIILTWDIMETTWTERPEAWTEDSIVNRFTQTWKESEPPRYQNLAGTWDTKTSEVIESWLPDQTYIIWKIVFDILWWFEPSRGNDRDYRGIYFRKYREIAAILRQRGLLKPEMSPLVDWFQQDMQRLIRLILRRHRTST